MTEKETKILVCMGSSCFARGNDKNLEFIKEYSAKKGLASKIELVGSRCENKCIDGPNILINGIECKEATKDKIKVILDEIIAEKN
ncbi:(2Fe-2S) ferredoxin domain-containing protein [bacterium]|nr:(2Fe-2S) ferredoxin domain-containing protein [bacterium]